MTPLQQQIRNRLNELVTELKELKFGCDVRVISGNGLSQGTILERFAEQYIVWLWDSEGLIVYVNRNEIEILGTPPTLQDVLRVVAEQIHSISFAVTNEHLIFDGKKFGKESYDLTKGALDQSQEFLEWLWDIIKP